MPTWIKICATTCIEDALASIEAGADALGFVFAPSKRQVSAEQAEAIASKLPRDIERIGVFCNDPADRVAEVVQQVGLTAIQLHSQERPGFIHELKQKLPAQRRIKIIKTVLVDENFEASFNKLSDDRESVDCILLDSGGGSGRTFDWNRAEPLLAHIQKHLIVAGGLNAANVGDAIRKFSPWGVDVVTGVEREPGRKDPEKLKAFVAAVRRAEQL